MDWDANESWIKMAEEANLTRATTELITTGSILLILQPRIKPPKLEVSTPTNSKIQPPQQPTPIAATASIVPPPPSYLSSRRPLQTAPPNLQQSDPFHLSIHQIQRTHRRGKSTSLPLTQKQMARARREKPTVKSPDM
jgi:hypothetical protein